jgi:hypothetical protein
VVSELYLFEEFWSPEADLNRRPRPYQGRALPTELSGPFFPHISPIK